MLYKDKNYNYNKPLLKTKTYHNDTDIKIYKSDTNSLYSSYTLFIHAQPGGLGDDPGVDAPIDGGLSILLAAGAAYGIKKVRDNSKKKD